MRIVVVVVSGESHLHQLLERAQVVDRLDALRVQHRPAADLDMSEMLASIRAWESYPRPGYDGPLPWSSREGRERVQRRRLTGKKLIKPRIFHPNFRSV